MLLQEPVNLEYCGSSLSIPTTLIARCQPVTIQVDNLYPGTVNVRAEFNEQTNTIVITLDMED